MLEKKNLIPASTSFSGSTAGTVPAPRAAMKPGQALKGSTVATGEAVESTM